VREDVLADPLHHQSLDLSGSGQIIHPYGTRCVCCVGQADGEFIDAVQRGMERTEGVEGAAGAAGATPPTLLAEQNGALCYWRITRSLDQTPAGQQAEIRSAEQMGRYRSLFSWTLPSGFHPASIGARHAPDGSA
jgi:hypothetical protein